MLVSCTAWSEEGISPNNSSELPSGHNIAIMAGSGSATRTHIDPSDMQSVRWSEDDKIALWAKAEGASQYSFAAAPLSLYYYGSEFDTAIFTGNTPSLADGTYSYFATYPLPKKTNGSTVTLTLPSTQSGYYDGTADLMYARVDNQAPLTDDALQNGTMTFNHLAHAIRIDVPQDRDLLGATKKLQITFPQAVVGDATINLNDENPSIELSNSSKSIYIDFDKVISQAGYVWLFIAPTTIDGEVEFVGYDENNIPSKPIYKSLTNRVMAPGRITPITLTIPGESYREVVLKITENNIGENMSSVTLTAPKGALFAGDVDKLAIPADADGNFRFSYSAARYDAAFRAGDITVSFESTNTIVPRSPIRLTNDDKYLVNYRNYTIPYLFEEDFSKLTESGTYDGLTSKALPSLDKYWTDGRIYKYWAGKCVALRPFSLGITYYAYLSLNLSGKTYLKPNTNVTLKFDFNADWKKNSLNSASIKIYDNDNDKNVASVALSNNSKASQDYIPSKHTLLLQNCKPTTKIVWQSDQNGSGWRKYDYIYLDNIKISIK